VVAIQLVLRRVRRMTQLVALLKDGRHVLGLAVRLRTGVRTARVLVAHLAVDWVGRGLKLNATWLGTLALLTSVWTPGTDPAPGSRSRSVLAFGTWSACVYVYGHGAGVSIAPQLPLPVERWLQRKITISSGFYAILSTNLYSSPNPL